MAEDLRDAVVWTLHNAQLVAQGSNVELDTDNFFVMGQSAGGTNATTLFLSPGLLPREILPHVKGLILMGVTTHISRKEDCEEAVLQYYGSEEEMKEHEPLTLLTRAPQEIIDSLPRIFMLKSEKEPLFILEGYDMFVKLLKERNHSPAREEVMQGHNHISPALSLGSGEGEEFGEQIAQWIIDTAALD